MQIFKGEFRHKKLAQKFMTPRKQKFQINIHIRIEEKSVSSLLFIKCINKICKHFEQVLLITVSPLRAIHKRRTQLGVGGKVMAGKFKS